MVVRTILDDRHNFLRRIFRKWNDEILVRVVRHFKSISSNSCARSERDPKQAYLFTVDIFLKIRNSLSFGCICLIHDAIGEWPWLLMTFTNFATSVNASCCGTVDKLNSETWRQSGTCSAQCPRISSLPVGGWLKHALLSGGCVTQLPAISPHPPLTEHQYNTCGAFHCDIFERGNSWARISGTTAHARLCRTNYTNGLMCTLLLGGGRSESLTQSTAALSNKPRALMIKNSSIVFAFLIAKFWPE